MAPTVPPTREGIVREFATMPITAQPGARFQYCSRCVVLAAYALEQIVGQSWEAYTRTHIFVPLGMAMASFGPLGLEQAPDRAQPYRHDAVSGEVPIPWSRLQYLQALAPAGGIDASVSEIADYALLQLDDGMLAGHRVVSAQMMAELHRPQIAVGADWTAAARIQNLHYALGWFTADVRGVHLVYHNGANPGFRAAIVLAPSAKAGVVCAAEVQRAMIDREAGMSQDRRISFRIGINLGDIIVDGDDIFGDGVNVAVRLESACVNVRSTLVLVAQ
jgi:CubicO group peptidase (beta-lactamase class C family)